MIIIMQSLRIIMQREKDNRDKKVESGPWDKH